MDLKKQQEITTHGQSKSKVKRLNRRAKLDRIESSLKSERSKRVVAEKASTLWKEKALLFKRFVVFVDAWIIYRYIIHG